MNFLRVLFLLKCSTCHTGCTKRKSLSEYQFNLFYGCANLEKIGIYKLRILDPTFQISCAYKKHVFVGFGGTFIVNKFEVRNTILYTFFFIRNSAEILHKNKKHQYCHLCQIRNNFHFSRKKLLEKNKLFYLLLMQDLHAFFYKNISLNINWKTMGLLFRTIEFKNIPQA